MISQEHDTHVITSGNQDIRFPALVDTACAKSVSRKPEAQALLDYCEENNWPVRKVEDEEPFKFGPAIGYGRTLR